MYVYRVIKFNSTQLWQPIFTSHRVQLPVSCPLHLHRDTFRHYVLRATSYRSDLWVCDLCGKAFHSKGHLGMHMRRAHHEDTAMRTVTEDTVCFAQYCDIFR